MTNVLNDKSMFKKSQKSYAKIKIALSGVSGSGKTYSALRLASGLGKKIAVIDTENGSASLYADKFNFDVLEIHPPFTTAKYVKAIENAKDAGYDVLIIDSISHQWAGEGGLLHQKEEMDATDPKASFKNWSFIGRAHEQFKSAIIQTDIHIICTMRSKMEHVVEKSDNGKSYMRKVGLAPIQRDNMEYEFATMFDIDISHHCFVTKDRTGLFVDKSFKITETTGEQIEKWLSGLPIPAMPKIISTDEAKKEIAKLVTKYVDEVHKIDREQYKEPLNTLKDFIRELAHQDLLPEKWEDAVAQEFEKFKVKHGIG